MDKRFPFIFIQSEGGAEEVKNGESGDDDQKSNGNNKGMIQWNAEEKLLFVDLLRTHGRDWGAIAEGLPRKTDKQCRNYF